MAGHVMVPLQSLSLELPDGESVVGYNKDTSALQGRKKNRFHLLLIACLSDCDFASVPDGTISIPMFVAEEISTLRSRQRHLDRRRREALDRLIDLKGTVFNSR